MQSIWKFKLDSRSSQEIELPIGSRFLHLQAQSNYPAIWFLVETSLPTEAVTLDTYGTGFILPDDPGEYLGTYLMDYDSLVFHVFRKGAGDAI